MILKGIRSRLTAFADWEFLEESTWDLDSAMVLSIEIRKSLPGTEIPTEVIRILPLQIPQSGSG